MTDKELPCFKPVIRRMKRHSEEGTDFYPRKEGKLIFVGREGDWELFFSSGTHVNLSVAKLLCGNEEELPQEVADLYHPVTQLRLALGLDVTEMVEFAKLKWEWLWFRRS